MPNKKTIYSLIAFSLILISFILWRWYYIPLNNIDFVSIEIKKSQSAHPLDELLRKNIFTIQNKPELAEFFKRKHKLTNLPSLWFDQCEVTQKQFGKFRQWLVTQEQKPLISHHKEPQNWKYYSTTAGHKLLGRLNMPASGVSYYEAFAYCKAAGGRLPHASEFEAVSNAKENRLYPWGNNIREKISQAAWPFRDPVLNVQQCKKASITKNADGIEDLGNNLSEWVQLEEKQALMGGNAYFRPVALHALNLIRRPAPADYRSQYVGFRCVYDRPKSQKNSNIKLPWNSKGKIIAVESGFYPIGVTPASKIAKMMRLLEPKQLKELSHLPIEQNELNLKISKTEITVKQYQRFLKDPLVQIGFFNHSKHPQSISLYPKDWSTQQTKLSNPITNISWWAAWAFAKSIGGRLPTEREWKRIAGARETLYPWGNDYEIGISLDRNHPNINNNEAQNAVLSSDNSLNNVLGLGGNVAEWTSSVIPYGNSFQLVVKGGSFELPQQGNQVSQASSISPNYTNIDLGFRVVKE